MGNVTAVGFDMDYTLAQYMPETFEQLVYDECKRNLVKKGYPKAVMDLEIDHEYMVRGLAVDKARGNVLKIDRHQYVKVAYHGFEKLESNDRHATYNTAARSQSFDEKDYAMTDTLFSIGETYLYAQLVDMVDNKPNLFEGEKKTYGKIYQDVREAVDMIHRDGSLKAAVAADPGAYIVDDASLVPLFKSLRESGRKVFLLTNSLYDYTDVVMTHLTREHEGRWQDYFDAVVVGSRKPSFFKTGAPPFEVDEETGMLRNTDGGSPLAQIGAVGALEASTIESASTRGLRVVQGGGVGALHSMLGVQSGSSVLYVGDHIYGDIVKSKKDLGWRTCLIIPELEKELNCLHGAVKVSLVELYKQREDADAIDDALGRHRWKATTQNEPLPAEFAELELRRDAARERHRSSLRSHHGAFHPVWGQLLKTGYQASRFAHQIERFACIYTSRVGNLALHSPDKSYRSKADTMPHDVWP